MQADKSYLAEAEKHNKLAHPDWSADRLAQELEAEADWLMSAFLNYKKVGDRSHHLLSQHKDLDVVDVDSSYNEPQEADTGRWRHFRRRQHWHQPKPVCLISLWWSYRHRRGGAAVG